MKGRFIIGLTTGALVGIAASMLATPQMDWRTKRKIKRAGKRLANRAGEFMDDIREYNM